MSTSFSRLLPGLLLVACGCMAHSAAASEAKPAPSPAAAPAAKADATPASAEPESIAPVPTDVDQVPRKPIDEAEALLKSGGALFLDVRDTGSYATGHIKGAINIPLEVIGDRLAELPHDKPIIVYCGWHAEHTSARAALQLLQSGFPGTTALLGGINAWREAGLPMEQ